MMIPDGRAQSFPILLSVSVEGMQTDILDPRQFCNLRLLALDLGTVEGLDPTRSKEAGPVVEVALGHSLLSYTSTIANDGTTNNQSYLKQ